MTAVKIHKAKTELSRLIAKVEAGEDVVIMRRETPVARLVRYAQDSAARRPGRLKGQISLAERFFEPLPDDELEAWADGLTLVSNEGLFDGFGVSRLW